MAADFKQLKIKGTSTRGRQTSFSWSLPRSSGVKLLLSEVKKKDLLDLCHMGMVPQEFFYKPYPATSSHQIACLRRTWKMEMRLTRTMRRQAETRQDRAGSLQNFFSSWGWGMGWEGGLAVMVVITMYVMTFYIMLLAKYTLLLFYRKRLRSASRGCKFGLSVMSHIESTKQINRSAWIIMIKQTSHSLKWQ